MKLTTAFITAAICAATASAKLQIVKGTDAMSILPATAQLGLKIEGASVNAAGELFAVDGSDVINLTDGAIALKGPGSAPVNSTSQLAGSRWLPNGSLVAGDAIGKKVYIVQKGQDPSNPMVLVQSKGFLQPNDIAVSSCGKFLYFSGMNYTATSVAGEHGELAWIDMRAPGTPLRKVSKEALAAAKVFRANGIEVIRSSKHGNKEFVYLTSAENKEFAVASTRIIRFEINPRTGEPSKGEVALDIGARLEKEGYITQANLTTVGMDPDGMRADAKGNLYMTLNAYGRVLRWNPDTDEAIMVELPTVAFPVNLEFGGKKGDELFVIGKCTGNEKPCVDKVVFDDKPVGRAYSMLNHLPYMKSRAARSMGRR
ncbi:hypothetical protein BDZ91DRAFT_726166 [Kalaharituber pfeilii]|nr:hypothetical protein BDZ91DRAFT_726166 [Kalaharituber pfeilii]